MTRVPERFLADRAAPLCGLEIAKPFSPPQVNSRIFVIRTGFTHVHHSSSPREKKYAHYVSQASWAGARIIQGQWTEQAQTLYDLIIHIFSENGKLANLEALKKKSGVSDEEWEDLLQYSSQVRV